MESTFAYRVMGRTPGVAEPVVYEGEVSAASPKDAILASLVANFGNPDSNKPLINKLCDDGWVDVETVGEQLAELDENANAFCLDTGDFTFDVEVSPVIVH